MTEYWLCELRKSKKQPGYHHNYFDYIPKSQGEIKKAIEDTITNDPRITSDNLQIDVDSIGTLLKKL